MTLSSKKINVLNGCDVDAVVLDKEVFPSFVVSWLVSKDQRLKLLLVVAVVFQVVLKTEEGERDDVDDKELVVDNVEVYCVVEGNEDEVDVSVSAVGSSVTSSDEDFELLVVITVFEVKLGVGDVVVRGEELEEDEIDGVVGEEKVVDDLVVCCVVEGNEVVIGIELDEGDDEKDVVDGDVVDGDEVLDEVEIGDVAGEEMAVDDLVVCCVVEGNEEETDVSVSVVGSSVISSVEDFELLVAIVVFEVVIGIELDEEDDEKDVAVGDVVDGEEIPE